MCAGAGALAEVLCRATRPSSSSPGLPEPLLPREEGLSAAGTDKLGTAFWAPANAPGFLLLLSKAWNKIQTKMLIPVCGRVY